MKKRKRTKTSPKPHQHARNPLLRIPLVGVKLFPSLTLSPSRSMQSECIHETLAHVLQPINLIVSPFSCVHVFVRAIVSVSVWRIERRILSWLRLQLSAILVSRLQPHVQDALLFVSTSNIGAFVCISAMFGRKSM